MMSDDKKKLCFSPYENVRKMEETQKWPRSRPPDEKKTKNWKKNTSNTRTLEKTGKIQQKYQSTKVPKYNSRSL